MNEAPASTRTDAERRTEIRRARISIDFFVVATMSLAAESSPVPWVSADCPSILVQMPNSPSSTPSLWSDYCGDDGRGYHRYVPALTMRILPYPRLLMPELILYLIRCKRDDSPFRVRLVVGCLVRVIVTIVGFAMFAANMVPLFWHRIAARLRRKRNVPRAVFF